MVVSSYNQATWENKEELKHLVGVRITHQVSEAFFLTSLPASFLSLPPVLYPFLLQSCAQCLVYISNQAKGWKYKNKHHVLSPPILIV
jgi:hypothetical protein